MAGIYIHIPFCKKACIYCNFHFSLNLKYIQRMMNAIKKEIYIRKNSFPESIESIYFGGGTPSIIEHKYIFEIISIINDNFNLSKNTEITIECNPEDLNNEKIKKLIESHINRFSIGIQSFFEKDLILVNRNHTNTQYINIIKSIKSFGIDNISIDLIYGFPNQSKEQWNTNITKSLELNIKHISAYALTIERQTRLYGMINKKKIKKCSEKQYVNYFIHLKNILEKNGFIHYEISNFAKEGFQSIHNSNYWNDSKYLGIGPSAHSYDGQKRWWNISNNIKYMINLEKNMIPQEYEIINDRDKANEYIMTNIRRNSGINLNKIQGLLSKNELNELNQTLYKLIKDNKIVKKNDNFILTNQGMLIADNITTKLFT